MGLFSKGKSSEYGLLLTCVGGMLYFDGNSNDDSLQPAMATAMLFLMYAQIASTDDKKQTYNVGIDQEKREL